MMSQTVALSPMAELMVALHCTEADLIANRQGTITASQRSNLGHAIFDPLIPLPGLALKLLPAFILVTPVVFVMLTLKLTLKEPTFVSPNFIQMVGITLIAWVFTVLMMAVQFVPEVVTRWWRIRSDLSSGSVAVIGGRIYLHTKGREVLKGTKHEYYELYINGLTFTISARQWQAFASYQPYLWRIYYLRASKVILCAEQTTRTILAAA